MAGLRGERPRRRVRPHLTARPARSGLRATAVLVPNQPQESLAAVRSLRAAVRALLAHAVLADEPSPADARSLILVPEALDRLNAAAAAVPTVPRLYWPDEGDPLVSHHPTGAARHEDAVPAALARAVIGFLAGPDRATLRACHAPRCVRYFIKEHPRQEWCKPSYGNRARVARHPERHRSSHP
ncbi:CGNR zinc finger domain-containing protein [Streptomyces sp. NPDC005262]|uniref:CGNR zinc finger domain-containing protein n=1 Tax=Streptomyces sp. NPDC005262 TaxID=3364710 RepID=UPI0036C147B6